LSEILHKTWLKWLADEPSPKEAEMKLAYCCLIALLLVACGESRQSPPPKLFESQRQALDKAHGVEKTVNQQADQQKQEADRQTE
jgi:hypothetical protein